MTIARTTQGRPPLKAARSRIGGRAAPDVTALQLSTLRRAPLLSEAVQSAIKSFIAENGLRPSDPLPSEPDLARQLGVSRNSVREAVKALQALGVIAARAGSGLYVSEFSLTAIVENLPYGMARDLRKLEEALDLRSYVELGMAERIVANVSDAQMDALNGILNVWHVAAKRAGFPPEQDQAFHRALSGNVGNALVGDVLDIFWQVRNQARLQGSAAEPEDPMRTYATHKAIATALARRDVAPLREAIRRHYEDARAGLRPASVRARGRSAAGRGTRGGLRTRP